MQQSAQLTAITASLEIQCMFVFTLVNSHHIPVTYLEYSVFSPTVETLFFGSASACLKRIFRLLYAIFSPTKKIFMTRQHCNPSRNISSNIAFTVAVEALLRSGCEYRSKSGVVHIHRAAFGGCSVVIHFFESLPDFHRATLF